MRNRQTPATPPVFPKVFPRPTGRNGWEGVVLAADRLAGTAWDAFEALPPDQIDRDKVRRLMATAPLREILDDVMVAAGMPFATPRPTMDFRTELPDLASFRKVARFLAAAMFDAAVAGRGRTVVGIADAGIRIARAVRGEAMIGTLVAVAAETLLLRRIAQLAPLLSEAELATLGEALLGLARAPLAWRDGLEREHRIQLVLFTDAQRTATRRTLEESDDPQTRALAGLFGEGADADAARALATDRLRRMLERGTAILEDPTRYRLETPRPADDPAGRLVDALVPPTDTVLARVLALVTEERLLGLYLLAWSARRRRLTWPGSLADIARPADLRQPVTGTPVDYVVLPEGDAVVLRARPIPVPGGAEARALQVPAARAAG